MSMKVTNKGQVTIPSELRKRHGLLPRHEVEFVDQPNGVLVVKAGKLTRGKRVLAALLRGGKVKGDTESWLHLTRGAAYAVVLAVILGGVNNWLEVPCFSQ